MTSSEAVGPIDIHQLLDLLNASDRVEPRPNIGGPLIQSTEPEQPEETIPPGSKEISPRAELSDAAALSEVENRFAAHIVHGMSKLKGG
jgi:hypothetical protein